MCFGKSVVDILAKRMQWDATCTLFLLASDIAAAETTGNLQTDSFCPKAHRHLDRSFHRPTEGNTAFELQGHIFSNELSVELRSFDLLNIEKNLATGRFGQVFLDFLQLLPLPSDNNPGPGGQNLHTNTIRCALNQDSGYSGKTKLSEEIPADLVVFKNEFVEVLFIRVPTRLPVTPNGKAKTNWIYFLAHKIFLI